MKNYRIMPMIMLFGWMMYLPSCGQPSPVSKKERIEALLDSRYKSDEPGAAVLVALKGEYLIRDAYGMADLEKSSSLSADHSFAIGSVTKQFTAAAILLLHQQGKLSIHDAISNYFPEASNHPGVQIHHLLTHSAGIKDLFRIEAWNSNLAQDLYVSESLQTGRVMVKDENVCLHCGLCAERCPTTAWDMQKFLYNVSKAGQAA